MKRKRFNLPPCTGGRSRGVSAVLRFCGCYRCAVVRATALYRTGTAHSDLAGAALTRAVTENA